MSQVTPQFSHHHYTLMEEQGRVLSVRSAGRLQRHLAPPGFSTLPIEIVVRILLFVLPQYTRDLHTTSNQHYATLHLLAQVSKDWRDIVLGWPDFWVRVDCRTPRRIWSSALELSKLSPITVLMEPEEDEFSNTAEFWDAVFPKIGRWERATLTCSSRVVSDLNEPETHAPELRAFTIGVEQDAEEIVTLDLREGMAPKLESLTLVNIVLRSWDSVLLARLQRLALCNVRILPQELMLALRECRTLVQLLLDGLEFSSGGEEPPVLPKNTRPIFLSSLTDLCVKDIGSEITASLLATLKTPRCTSFLLGSIWGMTDTSILACIDFITPAARLAFTSPTHIEFFYDPYGLRLRVRCHGCTWQFKLLEETAVKLITWVLSTFKDVLNRTPIEITFESLRGDQALLISEPGFLNSLSCIETICAGPDIDPETLAALISALSQPQSGGEWEGRWLCPHLRHLHIEADYTRARALMRMLRNRKKSAGAVSALGTLELSHESTLSAKTFRKIERVAGLHVLRQSKAQEQETKWRDRRWVGYWTQTIKETWSSYGMREVYF
ncbi:hypothetical protein FRB94_003129 [Tulasnella sp. JGI-2019a]|nr:hypothetical protein FRB94_003129 [Tulasnella sp. JGI-2019a]